MFQRSTHQRRRDLIGILAPSLGTLPTVRGHQIVEHLAHRFRRNPPLLRPPEMLRVFLSNGHKHHPGTQLWHAEVRSRHQLPTWLITEFQQLRTHILPVIFKYSVQNSPHVFYHHGPRPDLIHQPDHRRKKIPFVLGSKLLSGNRKRRARQPPRDDIYILKSRSIERIEILLNHVPLGAVQPQRRAGVLTQLHQSSVLNSRLLISECLPTGSRTQLQCGESASGTRSPPRARLPTSRQPRVLRHFREQ